VVFGLNSDGVLGVSHSGRTGVDEVTSNPGLAGRETIREHSWLRAYYRLSATMLSMELIDTDMEHLIDGAAVDCYRRMKDLS